MVMRVTRGTVPMRRGGSDEKASDDGKGGW